MKNTNGPSSNMKPINSLLGSLKVIIDDSVNDVDYTIVHDTILLSQTKFDQLTVLLGKKSESSEWKEIEEAVTAQFNGMDVDRPDKS